MILRGHLAEMMVLAAPEVYRNYITDVNGKKVLYVKVKKAIYGLMKSALLFYRKLWTDLSNDGFKLNPYDPCVANKMVNGKQMTVCWHVDDLKMFHAKEDVLTAFINRLEGIYGKLSVLRGKVHEYLGMTFDYLDHGKVKILMPALTRQVLEEFPDDTSDTAEEPAGARLFDVRDTNDKGKSFCLTSRPSYSINW